MQKPRRPSSPGLQAAGGSEWTGRRATRSHKRVASAVLASVNAGLFHWKRGERTGSPNKQTKPTPCQHPLDSAYTMAPILVSSQRQYGIEVPGPARGDVKWQANTEQ